jgi:hypothetical protein
MRIATVSGTKGENRETRNADPTRSLASLTSQPMDPYPSAGMSSKSVETSDDLQGYLGPLLEEVPRSYVFQPRKLAEHYRKLASGVPSRLRSTTVSGHKGFGQETHTNRISAIPRPQARPLP